MHKWGLVPSANCRCGRAEEQTADHILAFCPLYHPPNGTLGLAVDWLQTTELCIWWQNRPKRRRRRMNFVGFTASQQESNRSRGSTFFANTGARSGVKLFGVGLESESKKSDSNHLRHVLKRFLNLITETESWIWLLYRAKFNYRFLLVRSLFLLFRNVPQH